MKNFLKKIRKINKLVKFLLNLKIQTKLLLLLFIVLSIFVTSSVLSVYTLNKVKVGSKLYESIQTLYKSLGNLALLKSDLNQIELETLILVAEPNLDNKKQIIANIKLLRDEINLKFIGHFTLDEEDKYSLNVTMAQETWSEFITTVEEELIPMMLREDTKSSREIVFGIQKKRYNRFIEHIDILIDTITQEIEDSEESVKKSILTKRLNLITVSGILFLALFALAFFMGKSILVRINKLVVFVQNIAQGDFSKTIDMDSRDEIGEIVEALGTVNLYLSEMAKTAEMIAKGDLSRNIIPKSENDLLGHSFKNMVVYLRDMAITTEEIAEGNLSTINVALRSEKDILGKASLTMISGLKKTISEINRGSEEIATAADNIFTSTTELSTMTAHQANIISNIAATISEIKKTSEQSGHMAEKVIEVSKNSATVSEEGLSSVERTIEGMEIIQQQVEIIRKKIVTLSSQTDEISEIIATVKDLAEQSNVLALNALIEAARAGEQGRGFAVVADEVKNLAKQSKLATTEVATILSNIQNATDSVVTVVQEGSQRTDEGVKLARDAGYSITRLVEDINKSSHAAMQIAASVKEQTIGIDQVSLAIDTINEAVKEIVDMIVQMEKAASNMAALSKKLRVVIDQYTF